MNRASVASAATLTIVKIVALVAVVTLPAVGCAPPLMKLPTGSGAPVGAVAVAAALAQATTRCASVRTMTAEIAVSGSAGGHRLRARLSAGVAAPASIRLEAVAPFGPPLFIFVATNDDATLLLPREERVLEHGRPDAVLEAVAGVPLDVTDLEAALTGCAISADSPSTGRQFGNAWLVVGRAGGDELYLRRDTATGPWGLVAMVRRRVAANRRWRAEFGGRQNEIPQTVRVISVDEVGGAGGAFDLRLALSQVDVNTALDEGVFKVQVFRSAVPITLDELRHSGPLGNAR